MPTRAKLILLHVLIGGFFLPVALMFAITGALYTVGITGDYRTQELTLTRQQLGQPDQREMANAIPEPASLAESTRDLLASRGLSVPSGSPKLKRVGTSWIFEWTGRGLDFTVEPTTDPDAYQVKIKETGWHRMFVQLHKAKGGVLFKGLAVLLGLGLVTLFLIGWQTARTVPHLHRWWKMSALGGLAVFVIAVFLS